KATKGAQATYNSVDAIVFAICNFLPYYLVMFFYLFKLDGILSIALLFVFVPMIFSHWIKSKWYGKLEDSIAPIRREYTYYLDYMSNKETRVLGIFKFFRNKTKEVIKVLNREIWKNEKRTELFEAGMTMITLFGYGGILFLFTRSLLNGNISTAAFAAIFGSIDSMFIFLSIVLTRNISIVSQNFGLVKNYYNFCNLEIKKGCKEELDVESGIQLKNVSFLYPNKEIKALKNINLDIKNKETIAFVGENGSGKSTLAKIIAGLYQPTEGEVNIFGRNRANENVQQRYEGISAVFQDFQKYKMSLKTNIQISDLTYEETYQELDHLAKIVGIDMNNRSITNGYDTILSRDFDGVDLSIGQWQRLVIARGIHRKSKLIFLDEPTASIDPVEESELFKQFMNMSKDYTTIIITHRLGSAKIADRICVLDKGSIVEIGTHSNLMKKNGLYKKLYQTQAKWYVN
ncbi:MAG: ABC transporter ATP-binding protein, partial [Clostridiales bacterium]